MVYRPTVSPEFKELPDLHMWVQQELERISSDLAENETISPPGGGGDGDTGIEEAPNDGKQYARQDESWQEVEQIPGEPGPPGEPGGVLPGSITIGAFDPGLRDYVENELSKMMIDTDWIQQLIANEATEQDAHNWMEKLSSKRADVTMREQVSAQFGLTWRGEWNEFTQYYKGDQVRFNDLYYWTDVPVLATAPGSVDAPWTLLSSIAVISEQWKSFAGDDGVVAQTSDSIELRFGTGTLPISTANLIDNWAGFAGPTYAAAQTSQSIETRFGSATTPISLASLITQWDAFAGTDHAAAQTSASIEAMFGGTAIGPTVPLSLATLTERWKAYAGPDLAITSSETEIKAAIGDNTASVTTLSAAVVVNTGDITTNKNNISGINTKLAATWQVTLNVNNYVSGLKAYNDGSVANFVIITDTFAIAQPSTGQGATPVFGLSTRDGIGKLVLRGDMIADGSVNANSILANSVNANHVGANTIVTQAANITNLVVDNIKITDGAVTNFGNAVFSGNYGIEVFGFQEILACNVTCRGVPGRNIFIYVTGTIDIYKVGASGAQGAYRVLIAGIEVQRQTFIFGTSEQIIVNPLAAGLDIGATGGSQDVRCSLEVAKSSGAVGALHTLTARMCAQSFAR